MATVRLGVDDWAFSVLDSYALRGTCVRRQAGAIGLDERNRIIGLGMNGVPSGMTHCTEAPCEGAKDLPGDTRRCMAIHAEINMIANSLGADRIVKVYTSATPCFECAKVLANLPNLKQVISKEHYADARGVYLLRNLDISVEVRADERKL